MWLLRRNFLLKEFIINENVDVRRSIVPHLRFDNPSDYSEELRPLLPQVIAIARTHPDDYIRQRIEVQLGNSDLLPALPSRGSP
jgi:hypothetical protein